MKLPISWLKKYISVKATPEKLAEILTMSGTAVEGVEKISGDAVLNIEVTTNRPDCLSILGLAREVAALTGESLKTPSAYSDPVPGGHVSKGRKKFLTCPPGTGSGVLVIEDKKACPLYTARIICGVSMAPAPEEARQCLEKMGTRSISNVVDATNFVLFESGQPLHAFDLDKVQGKRIVVRRSRMNEKFLGIDGIEYILDDKTLVIADAERVIAIAGVMGGKLTEVTDATKNILLESAYFDPALVRQASRRYKITTESSYRFERSVDPAKVALASARASLLICEWAGGTVTSGLLQASSDPVPGGHVSKGRKKSLTCPPRTGSGEQRSVILRLLRVEQLLGMKLSDVRVISILKTLGFGVVRKKAGVLNVSVGSDRRDVTQEADLIEEILRIEGFEKIPVKIPSSRHSIENHEDRVLSKIFEAKKFLAASGLREIITYSLLSGKALSMSGFEQSRVHRIVNPVSAEQEYLRPSLVPGLLQSAVYNAHRKAEDLALFEIGNVYENNTEEWRLGIVLYGFSERNWMKKHEAGFYDLKGIVERFIAWTGFCGELTWKKAEGVPWIESGAVLLNNGQETVAELGQVSANVCGAWDIPGNAFVAELRIGPLLKKPQETIRVRRIGRFPSVRRDFAFIVDEMITVADLEHVMREVSGEALREVRVFDQYKGKNIPEGKRSLAFSLSFQKEDGTFTDDEIHGYEQKVKEALTQRCGVQLRASI